MRLTRKSLWELKEKFHNVFCLVAAKPISEKWATCYNCNVALRVISHLPICGFVNKTVSKHTPIGVCLELNFPTNKLISLIDFKLSQHIILCTTCLGNSFLAIDGSLFTRCLKCLSFFLDVEPGFDGMYWEEFQGTDYDMHVASCKKQEKAKHMPSNCHNHGSPTQSLFTRFSSRKLTKIKPFLLRKDQIK